MTRTIISLDEADKAWLDKRSVETGRPRAEIVREALRRLRAEEEAAFDKALHRTRGLWKQGDGLQYQRRSRKQWR